MERILVCSNEGPHPFSRGYNSKHWWHIKIFFYRTNGRHFIQTLHKLSFNFLQIKNFSILKKKNYELSLFSTPKWWCNHRFVQVSLLIGTLSKVSVAIFYWVPKSGYSVHVLIFHMTSLENAIFWFWRKNVQYLLLSVSLGLYTICQ